MGECGPGSSQVRPGQQQLISKSLVSRRQRRLFDDTKEGEKVMSLLTSLSPGDLANMLHPTLIQVTMIKHSVLPLIIFITTTAIVCEFLCDFKFNYLQFLDVF